MFRKVLLRALTFSFLATTAIGLRAAHFAYRDRIHVELAERLQTELMMNPEMEYAFIGESFVLRGWANESEERTRAEQNAHILLSEHHLFDFGPTPVVVNQIQIKERPRFSRSSFVNDIKGEFLKTLGPTQIKIRMIGTVIILSGFVDRMSDRQAAEDVALAALTDYRFDLSERPQSVKNLIKVRKAASVARLDQ